MWEQTATSPSTRDVPPLLCSWPSNEGERMCEGTSGNSEMCETSHGGRGGHVNFANPADVTVHAKVLAAGELLKIVHAMLAGTGIEARTLLDAGREYAPATRSNSDHARGSATSVVNDDAVLQEIWDFLLQPGAGGRVQLSILALVSRQWKALAVADTFWRPISFDLFPAWPEGRKEAHGGKDWKKEAQERVRSDIEAKGIVQRLSAPAAETEVESMRSSLSSLSPASSYTRDSSSTGLSPAILAAFPPGGTILSTNTPRTGCRAQVMAYGKAVGNPRFRTASAWQKDINMVFEVTDTADNCRLFYGEGPIQVSAGQNVTLRLAGACRFEVSAPFSAADRDQELGRFPTVREYFKYGHGLEYSANLRVRVVLCDHRSGRLALLYQSDKTAKRHAKTPNAPYWQDFLPGRSFYIWDPDTVCFGSEGQIKLAAAFYVVPADEDGVVGREVGVEDGELERRRMYKVAGGNAEEYATHASFVSLDFNTADGDTVGRFINSLLAP